mmetsp:Transcript_42511/g.92780  ORF Transcript_42511/g.92780 Transcript_42511/m.92780 type:complete len:373 (+) Transcript_42511:283-1401(+)
MRPSGSTAQFGWRRHSEHRQARPVCQANAAQLFKYGIVIPTQPEGGIRLTQPGKITASRHIHAVLQPRGANVLRHDLFPLQGRLEEDPSRGEARVAAAGALEFGPSLGHPCLPPGHDLGPLNSPVHLQPTHPSRPLQLQVPPIASAAPPGRLDPPPLPVVQVVRVTCQVVLHPGERVPVGRQDGPGELDLLLGLVRHVHLPANRLNPEGSQPPQLPEPLGAGGVHLRVLPHRDHGSGVIPGQGGLQDGIERLLFPPVPDMGKMPALQDRGQLRNRHTVAHRQQIARRGRAQAFNTYTSVRGLLEWARQTGAKKRVVLPGQKGAMRRNGGCAQVQMHVRHGPGGQPHLQNLAQRLHRPRQRPQRRGLRRGQRR